MIDHHFSSSLSGAFYLSLEREVEVVEIEEYIIPAGNLVV